jgi:hypothetical protein
VRDYAIVTNPGPDLAERTFELIIGNSAALESVLVQEETLSRLQETLLRV